HASPRFTQPTCSGRADDGAAVRNWERHRWVRQTTCACGQGAVAAVQRTVLSAGAGGLTARHTGVGTDTDTGTGTGSPCQAPGIVNTQGPRTFSPELRVMESNVSVSGPCGGSCRIRCCCSDCR